MAREEQKYASAAARKEYERKLGILNEQKQELGKKINNDNALFDRLIYQDITKRADVQNMMRLLDENQKKAEKRDAARAAVTGATEEQQLASKEQYRKSFADALATYGAQASNIKDMYMRDKLNMGNFNFAQRLGIANQGINLNNPESAIHANTANQLSTAANNAFKSGGSMLANGLGEIQPSQNQQLITGPEYIKQPPITPAGQHGVTGNQPPVQTQSTSVNYGNNKHQNG